MKASKKELHHERLELKVLPMRANLPIAVLVAASMVAFTPSQVLAKAPDTQGDVQASVIVAEEASSVSKDYQLAPGDRLTIVVYDQPQLSGQFIVESIRRQCEAGRAVLFSTHIMSEAEYLCDRILLLHRGHIIDEGVLDDLLARSGCPNLTDAFLLRVGREAHQT
jgi:hypothetical protein